MPGRHTVKGQARLVKAGKALAAAMDRHGVDVARLAKETGVTRDVAKRWTAGRRLPNDMASVVIVDLLGVDMHDIAGALPGSTEARRLRDLRCRAGLTQRQLAAMVGVSNTTLSLWESTPQERLPPGAAAAFRVLEELEAQKGQGRVDGEAAAGTARAGTEPGFAGVQAGEPAADR